MADANAFNKWAFPDPRQTYRGFVSRGGDGLTLSLGAERILKIYRSKQARETEEAFLSCLAEKVFAEDGVVACPQVLDSYVSPLSCEGALWEGGALLMTRLHGVPLSEEIERIQVRADAERNRINLGRGIGSLLRNFHQAAAECSGPLPAADPADPIAFRLAQVGLLARGMYKDAIDSFVHLLKSKGARQESCLHGDLHPANILVKDGRVTGFVDFARSRRGPPEEDFDGLAFYPSLLAAAATAYANETRDPFSLDLVWARAAAVTFCHAYSPNGVFRQKDHLLQAEAYLAGRKDGGASLMEGVARLRRALSL